MAVHAHLVRTGSNEIISAMDTSLLKTLLQVHLATDASAVFHLPYILRVLDESCFSTTTHLSKWIARLNALLHSKDQGGKWAGLCLTWKTVNISPELAAENGQNWLAASIPLLSVCHNFLGLFSHE